MFDSMKFDETLTFVAKRDYDDAVARAQKAEAELAELREHAEAMWLYVERGQFDRNATMTPFQRYRARYPEGSDD